MRGLSDPPQSFRLASAQLVVLFVSVSLNYKYATGAVIGEIQLLKFENKDNTDRDGNRCDLIDLSQCDTMFQVNISESVASSCITGKCLFNGSSDQKIENSEGIVDFLRDDTGLPRPIVVRWRNWDGGFQLSLEAIDKDYVTVDDSIDSHAITLRPRPQANKSVAIPQTYSSKGSRNINKTLLTLQVMVYCAPNHYGSVCTIYCNNELAPEKYTCSPDGSKQCLTGWYGKSCNIFCLPTKWDNYTCDSNGQKLCNAGWSGDDCDKPIPTATSKSVFLQMTTASSKLTSALGLHPSLFPSSSIWTLTENSVLPSQSYKEKSPSPAASSPNEGYSINTSSSLLSLSRTIPTSMRLFHSSGLLGSAMATQSASRLHTNDFYTEWIPTRSWQPSIKQETSAVQLSSLFLGVHSIPVDNMASLPHPSASTTLDDITTPLFTTTLATLPAVQSIALETSSSVSTLSSAPSSEHHSTLVKELSSTRSFPALSVTALPSLGQSVLNPYFHRTTKLAVLSLTNGTNAQMSTSAQQRITQPLGISKDSSTTIRVPTTNRAKMSPTTKPDMTVTSVNSVNNTSAGPEVKESRGLTMDSEIMQGTVSGVGLLILLIVATLVYCKCRSHRKGTKQEAPVKTSESTKFVRFQENQKKADILSKEGMEMHCQSNPVYFSADIMLNGPSQVSSYDKKLPTGDFDYCTVPAKSILKRKENANDCEVTSVHSFVNHSYANIP